ALLTSPWLHRLLFVYISPSRMSVLFVFNDTPTSDIYTLSLHDALPICHCSRWRGHRYRIQRPRNEARNTVACGVDCHSTSQSNRSEEHTSELQSRFDLVCRLLLEKKKKQK